MYLRLMLVGLVLAFASTVTCIVCLFRPFNPYNSTLYCSLSGRQALTILGLDWEIQGKEHINGHHPCVFIGNHQTNYDVFIATAMIPKRTLAVGKIELLWVPFFGMFFWLAGNILLNRGNKTKALASMQVVQNKLKSNFASILIMPEGTRSKGRGLLPFKKGAFHTAAHAGVPIVPFCISDWKFVNLNKWHAGKLILRALPPVIPTGNTPADIDNLMKKSREVMEAGILSINAEIEKSLA